MVPYKFIFTFSLLSIIFLFASTSDSWGFGTKEHGEITYEALIKDQILYGNLDQDRPEDYFNAEWHFDRCKFDESSEFIRDHYEEVIDETISTSNYPFRAAFSFGELLHGAQDFYSHSNWAEIWKEKGKGTIDSNNIVENGLDNWQVFEPFRVLTDNIFLLQYSQLNLPAGWSISSDIIPIVTDPQGKKYLGLNSSVLTSVLICWNNGPMIL